MLPSRSGLFALFLALQGPAETPKAAELTKLQGVWSVKAIVTSGNPNRRPPGFEVLVEGDRMTNIRISDGSRQSMMRFEVDPTKTPKQIDLIPENGPQIGRRLPGIYRIDGARLEICYVVRPGMPRPDAFESTPETKTFFVTYGRPGR